MSTQMSMEVISDHVCGNVCLFVMMIMVVTQGVSHSGVNQLGLGLG